MTSGCSGRSTWVSPLPPWRRLLAWLADYGVESCALAGSLQQSIDVYRCHPELVDNKRSMEKHRLADRLLDLVLS